MGDVAQRPLDSRYGRRALTPKNQPESDLHAPQPSWSHMPHWRRVTGGNRGSVSKFGLGPPNTCQHVGPRNITPNKTSWFRRGRHAWVWEMLRLTEKEER